MSVTKIQRVKFVTDSILKNCYYIADQTNPNAADVIFETLVDDININNEIMFTATIDNTLIGFIKGRFEQPRDYILKDLGDINATKIDWIYVDKKYAGRGDVGRALVNEYIKHEWARGADYIFARITERNDVIKFFKKQKFDFIGWGYMGKSLIQKVRSGKQCK